MSILPPMRCPRVALCLLVLSLLSRAAAAQQAAPTPAPPPATPGPASSAPAATPTAHAAQVPAAGSATDATDAAAPVAPPVVVTPAPEDPNLVEARQHFRQGVAFAAAGNCSAAIVEFEAAYALVPRANALYNIAQCQERLFRYDLAIQFYERYLAEAEADAPDRGAVQAALRTLGNLLGTVRIETNVAAQVWAGDRLVGEAPGGVLLPAGSHGLELRAEGYIPARAEVSLVGGQQVALELKLAKAQTTVQVTETTGLPPTVFWVGVGATVATAVVGTVFALQVVSLRDDALMLDPFDPAREDKRADAEDTELLADVFFGAAGVLGVATTVVAFVTDWEGDEGRRARDGRVRFRPIVSPQLVGVQLGGRL